MHDITEFRLSAKRFLLTYHRYTGDLRPMLSFFKFKLDHYGLQDYILVSEFVETSGGHEHVHAYLECTKRVDTRNPRYFDFVEPGTGFIFHPNILRVRDRTGLNVRVGEDQFYHRPEDLIEYALKYVYALAPSLYAGHVMASPGIRKRLGPRGNVLSASQVALQLAREQNLDSALNVLKLEDPSSYLQNYSSIREALYAEAVRRPVGFAGAYPGPVYESLLKELHDFLKKGTPCIALLLSKTPNVASTCMHYLTALGVNTVRVQNLSCLRECKNFDATVLDHIDWSNVDPCHMRSLLSLDSSLVFEVHMGFVSLSHPHALVIVTGDRRHLSLVKSTLSKLKSSVPLLSQTITKNSLILLPEKTPNPDAFIPPDDSWMGSDVV